MFVAAAGACGGGSSSESDDFDRRLEDAGSCEDLERLYTEVAEDIASGDEGAADRAAEVIARQVEEHCELLVPQ